MKRLLMLFSVVCFYACAALTLAPNSQAVALAFEQWRAVGLPFDAKCPGNLDVIIAHDGDDFRARCFANMPGDNTGGWAHKNACFVADGIVVAPSFTGVVRDGLIVHEALHALYGCDLAGADPYDAGHTDARVWGQQVPSSVEGRAYALILSRGGTP